MKRPFSISRRSIATVCNLDSMVVTLLSCILLSLLSLTAGRSWAQVIKAKDIGFCKPYTWLFGGWVAPNRLPIIGDINGDGYADFLYASPNERFIDVSLNGKGWKPLRGERLLSNLPQPIRSFCLGHFGGKGLDLAVLGSEGALTIAKNRGDGRFDRAKTVCTVPGMTANGRYWLLAGKRTAKSVTNDLFVIDGRGRIQLFGADGQADGNYDLRLPVTDALLADTHGDGVARLAVRSGADVIVYHLEREPHKLATIHVPFGTDALAAGDMDGDGKADLFINGQVYFAPDFNKRVALPEWESFKGPVTVLMADVAGHRRADVVVQHHGREYFGSKENDCDVYISYKKSDPDWDCDGVSNEEEAKLGSDPLDRCTSHDGIPDGWKVHGFAGIDLKAMGASPLHKDVFVLNLLYDNVPQAQVEKYMRDRVVPFFARIPCKNLDGTTGFAVHWITQLPALSLKSNSGKGWGQIAAETFPKEKIGLFHWMLVSGMGGGGQSSELADAGSTGMGSWIHEFGHQLGLSHTGKWATWSPTYTSLMNYSYSYQFQGDGNQVHFSTGEFSGLVLNESHLPGKVPYPIDKVRFLTGPPYHFRIQAADKESTYVDWGWSGVFSDRTVRANITFGYSVGGGERLQPSGTQPFNYNGPYELMTDYQPSFIEHKNRVYMATNSRDPVAPDAPRPTNTRLVLQTYKGNRAWSSPVRVTNEVIGDPCAASDGKTFYLCYRKAGGVFYRYGDPEKISEASEIAIPNSKGMGVSAVSWKGTLYLFLYRGPEENIIYRSVRESMVGPIQDLGIRGTIPPGLAVDTIQSQLLLGTATRLGARPYRWQLYRFAWNPESACFKEVSRLFVGGERAGWAGNTRPTLIFNPDTANGPQGRIYWIAKGVSDPVTAACSTFLAQTIGYKDINEGWQLWRYYDEWTNTRSGIGAIWHDNDIILATTWASGTAGGDGGVFCAYNGTAIGNTDMADFDDVSHMANFGMARSIATFALIPSKAAVDLRSHN